MIGLSLALLRQVFERADELAAAMHARGYSEFPTFPRPASKPWEVLVAAAAAALAAAVWIWGV
jgi:energy-coupling factor transporter transmembrane protein EcfT